MLVNIIVNNKGSSQKSAILTQWPNCGTTTSFWRVVTQETTRPDQDLTDEDMVDL